jgi:protein-S-isoprenylcysteine O-methyltransferase Ste14
MLAKHIALTVFVGAALVYICWWNAPAHWTPVRLLGLCLAVVGFTLWTVARFQLGTSFAVTAQARKLVTRGLYSRLQNPIYYFGALTIAGLILAFSRPVWLLIFVLVIPLQIWRIGKERHVLEAAFGEEYRQYRARTWF